MLKFAKFYFYFHYFSGNHLEYTYMEPNCNQHNHEGQSLRETEHGRKRSNGDGVSETPFFFK